jgi:threonine dehydrogenase-like Zn-dependent dehydrogenase
MLTALLKAPKTFEIVERPVPTPEAGEVLVETAATAVCHTDLGMYLGHSPGTKYPVVLGHESTGTIAGVGPGVAHLKVGQNVIINPIIACGHCDQCNRGARHLCRNAGLFGREVEGSLNQFVRLDARYVFPLPDHIGLADATIIETLATVRHAQQRAVIHNGQSVVVLGQGTSGLLHTRLAVLTGADPVIGITRTKWKLDMASKMGAHHIIQKSADDAVEDVLRLTNGEGADLIIDTAGGAHTLRVGIEMLAPRVLEPGAYSGVGDSSVSWPKTST